jgi:hypothetical protein
MLEHIQHAFGGSETNEAVNRFTLNRLLVFAYNHITQQSKQRGQKINLQVEKQWSYGPVKYKGTKCILSGKPDYCVWYGQKEEVAVSVVVVEAKTEESASTGVAQTLAYMGKYLTIFDGISGESNFLKGVFIDPASRRVRQTPLCMVSQQTP